MTASKKRAKRHTPRLPGIHPLLQAQMTRDAHPELAMQLYAALITLIERPSVEACNRISFRLACIAGGMSHAIKGQPILGRKDAGSLAIHSAIMAIEGIVDRHDRTGVVAVTDTEAKTLRAAAGKLDDALGRIPLPAYNCAVREVESVLGKGEIVDVRAIG